MCAADVNAEEGKSEEERHCKPLQKVCAAAQEHKEHACRDEYKILEVVEEKPVQDFGECIYLLPGAFTFGSRAEGRIQKDVCVNIYVVPVGERAVDAEVNEPGNDRQSHPEKEDAAGFQETNQASRKEQNHQHKREEEPKERELDAGDIAAEKAGGQNFLTGEWSAGGVLQAGEEKIQRPDKCRQAEFLRAASPVKREGRKSHCKQKRQQNQSCPFPQLQPENSVETGQIQDAEENFKQKNAGESCAGNQRREAVNQVKIRTFLIENVAVDHDPAEHGFSHREITVGIIPVVHGVQKR